MKGEDILGKKYKYCEMKICLVVLENNILFLCNTNLVNLRRY